MFDNYTLAIGVLLGIGSTLPEDANEMVANSVRDIQNYVYALEKMIDSAEGNSAEGESEEG